MTYSTSKQIRFKTSMLRSSLCDYSDSYIIVKEKITVTGPNDSAYDQKLAFKVNALFVSCISKINNTLIDNVENLDIVIAMHNLLECSKNYSKTSQSLWNYYRDEPNSYIVGDINYFIRNSKSFDYKVSITGRLQGTDTEKLENVVPLKYLSNWRTLDIPLNNWEVSLTLTWSANCIIT